MKKILLIVIFIVCSIGHCYPYPAKVYSINGKDYFPEVQRLLSEAKESIYISMYIATFYPNHKNYLPNKLLEELVMAKERGVKVKVLLDQERIYNAKDQFNDLAYFYLKDEGIEVYYDVVSSKLHNKIIVIDKRLVIIGSHNWSKSAFLESRESSVVIENESLAKDYIKWIEETTVSSRRVAPPSSKSANINIPYDFIFDRNSGSYLARCASGNPFNLYLYLLQVWKNKPFLLDYQQAADFVGIGDNRYIRRDINRLLRTLSNKYKLVSMNVISRESIKVALLDYKDKRSNLKTGNERSIILPGAFIEFGWIHRLSTSAKYFYLICLFEKKNSFDPDGWWSHSQSHLYKKYHLGPGALSIGVMELNRYNLLEVEYGDLIYPFDKYLSAPRYRLLPLYSWEWFQEEIKELENLYGKKRVAKARNWAKVILDENNLEVIEKLIQYSDEYGENLVKYAIAKVSEKRIANPKRSFPYVEGIIFSVYKREQEKQ